MPVFRILPATGAKDRIEELMFPKPSQGSREELLSLGHIESLPEIVWNKFCPRSSNDMPHKSKVLEKQAPG